MNRPWSDDRPCLCHGSSRLLFYDGWFYEGLLLRIHEKTWKCEYLVNGQMPAGYRSLHCGVSAHYGLVAWQTDTRFFQRVTIAPPQDPSAK